MGIPNPVASVFHIVPSHICILALYYSSKCAFNSCFCCVIHSRQSQGEGKSSKEALKRVDYGGSTTLLVAVSAAF